MTTELVDRAHAYLSAHAAESGADVLIAELADAVAFQRLRADTHERHNERLRLNLQTILEWHRNWDAPFHDEDEWIEDYRLAREELSPQQGGAAKE